MKGAGRPQIQGCTWRLGEVAVDCYDREKELSAFGVYLSDALRPPCAATWCDPDEPEHTETIRVLGVATAVDWRGILVRVQQQVRKERRILAMALAELLLVQHVVHIFLAAAVGGIAEIRVKGCKKLVTPVAPVYLYR